MKFNRKSTDFWVAQKRIESLITPVETETLSLVQSFGRRLAEDIFASHSVPHFLKSGMDGFAVRQEDIQGATMQKPVVLEVNQTIPCGVVPSLPVKKGQAARIMTGAPLPEGADTMVMFEMTESVRQEGKDYVTVMRPIEKGRNTSGIGSEIKQNDHLLEQGRKIWPGEAALLATFGHDQVRVFRKPRVTILTTGSELIQVSAPLENGKVRNSNSYMLASQIETAGAEVIRMESVPDDLALAKSFIENTFAKSDVVITSGGVSVGDYDIMVEFFDEWDGDVLFNKVEMRPGSVTTVGAKQGKFLFGLSGNPGACFVGFELFVRPVLNGMQGLRKPLPPLFTAFLEGDYTKANIYTRFVRGRTRLHEGKLYVKPVGLDQSGVVLSIKDSDCLIVIPPGGGALEGSLVTAVKLVESGC